MNIQLHQQSCFPQPKFNCIEKLFYNKVEISKQISLSVFIVLLGKTLQPSSKPATWSLQPCSSKHGSENVLLGRYYLLANSFCSPVKHWVSEKYVCKKRCRLLIIDPSIETPNCRWMCIDRMFGTGEELEKHLIRN